MRRNGKQFEIGLKPISKNTQQINVAFRVLREDEKPEAITASGIVCRDMNAGISFQKHIGGARQSQWVSVTSAFTVACINAMRDKCNVAVIDWSIVSKECTICDARNGLSGLGSTHRNWTTSAQELGVEYRIPAEAVVTVLSFDQIKEMCTTNNHTFDYYRPERRYSIASLKESFKANYSCVEGFANELNTWTDKEAFARFDMCVKTLWTKNRFTGNKIDVAF